MSKRRCGGALGAVIIRSSFLCQFRSVCFSLLICSWKAPVSVLCRCSSCAGGIPAGGFRLSPECSRSSLFCCIDWYCSSLRISELWRLSISGGLGLTRSFGAEGAMEGLPVMDCLLSVLLHRHIIRIPAPSVFPVMYPVSIWKQCIVEHAYPGISIPGGSAAWTSVVTTGWKFRVTKSRRKSKQMLSFFIKHLLFERKEG